ncbi:MAG TPA: polysaccharide biosynthesis/export family protein [Vicinamibacterales bacterium]|jgi:polysaccharide export outer membrane protein
MKQTSIAFAFAIAAGAVCTLAPRPAAAQQAAYSSTDSDKKPIAQGPALDSEYRLGPGDKLRIEVYKDAQLSQSVQIRPDGKITLPLVGDVEASGRTPIELRDTIAKSLKEYITSPTVTVIVVEALASQIYVMGEVSHPGPMPMHGPTTILQALAMAGGFKEFANTKDVRVLRPTSSGVQTLRFNYKDAINGDVKPFFLRSGDTVIVP